MMKYIYRKCSIIIASLLVIFSITILPSTAYAALPQCSTAPEAVICQTDQSLFGGVLKDVINIMLYLAGAIAVVMIVVGGIRYITSDGDPGAASKAKNTIIYALVGLVIAVMSYSIVNFVIGRV
ncbi:MAG: pilin [Patescibacteria group bacterium]